MFIYLCNPFCPISLPCPSVLSVHLYIHSPFHSLPRAMIFGEDSFLHLPWVRFQEPLTHRQAESPVQGRPAHEQEVV